MKAEITNENKAKFFALYWGQEVFNCDSPYKRNAIILGFQIDKYLVNGSHLFLKPLSSISDEDAIEVARLLYSYPSFESRSKESQVECIDEVKRISDRLVLHASIADFLRSRGYALPYLGLSVEEMVAAGWIKLTN